MNVIPETDREHYMWYLRLYYYHRIDNSAGGQLALKGIIHPVVSASARPWIIIYIYYWNLQFLNNAIINKTKVLLPQI